MHQQKLGKSLLATSRIIRFIKGAMIKMVAITPLAPLASLCVVSANALLTYWGESVIKFQNSSQMLQPHFRGKFQEKCSVLLGKNYCIIGDDYLSLHDLRLLILLRNVLPWCEVLSFFIHLFRVVGVTSERKGGFLTLFALCQKFRCLTGGWITHTSHWIRWRCSARIEVGSTMVMSSHKGISVKGCLTFKV